MYSVCEECVEEKKNHEDITGSGMGCKCSEHKKRTYVDMAEPPRPQL